MSAVRFPSQFGQNNYNRAKQDICSLLGIITLLGITWGLAFFSFGRLGTGGLYLFCVLNSLQGWSAWLTLKIWKHKGLCYVMILLCDSCFIFHNPLLHLPLHPDYFPFFVPTWFCHLCLFVSPAFIVLVFPEILCDIHIVLVFVGSLLVN